MDSIDTLDRLASALSKTSWRCDLGDVDPVLVERADALVGPLPKDYRAFLERVRTLENRAGDVTFLTARDLCDPESFLLQVIYGWRRTDEEAARQDPRAFAEVQAFWERVVPVLCSTVNGDDFLALNRGSDPPSVIEAWGEDGWSDSVRPCAQSFTDFLAGLADVFEQGPAAFDCGWRLSRGTIAQLQARYGRYREPLVPIIFMTDFNAAAPPPCPSYPPV